MLQPPVHVHSYGFNGRLKIFAVGSCSFIQPSRLIKFRRWAAVIFLDARA